MSRRVCFQYNDLEIVKLFGKLGIFGYISRKSFLSHFCDLWIEKFLFGINIYEENCIMKD